MIQQTLQDIVWYEHNLGLNSHNFIMVGASIFIHNFKKHSLLQFCFMICTLLVLYSPQGNFMQYRVYRGPHHLLLM